MNKGNTIFIGENKSFWERNRRSGGYLMKRRGKEIAISVFRALLMFGLCFMIIQPMVNRFAMSFMEENDLYDSTIVVLPRHVTLQNYVDVAALTNFPESMVNTLWISILMSVCQVISTTLVAYGFARFEFPLKKFWFACVVALIIIPPQTIQSALYMTFSKFDILGIFKATTGDTLSIRTSIWPYIMMCLTCMGLKDGLYIYMLRQYFKGVPESLEEAAYVDGCGTMHTFLKIMLPDAVPIIASCFLFSFVWQWTDLFYSRNFLSGYTLYAVQMSTMTTRMGRYYSTSLTDAITVTNGRSLQLISIAVLFCCIPLIILYCFTQRTFVESLAMTGSKE
ncbi:carbohydrate ABC transporter permease [Aristaeella lactis]|uniref:Multiple sugar transport system permease protein n=1 Tax=Aristaeella lactis TaxID=3046383 RepID=A0AC61PQV0_9FIRM|nr:carbohydrate ABC transporter permease [Aristaeella lactis]QUA54165.1 carbohydrate ABC transporter permease [Aristaeella lactis]SMC93629.1 multiple sugar transport system permease protein [Aristaeella lactis]